MMHTLDDNDNIFMSRMYLFLFSTHLLVTSHSLLYKKTSCWCVWVLKLACGHKQYICVCMSFQSLCLKAENKVYRGQTNTHIKGQDMKILILSHLIPTENTVRPSKEDKKTESSTSSKKSILLLQISWSTCLQLVSFRSLLFTSRQLSSIWSVNWSIIMQAALYN